MLESIERQFAEKSRARVIVLKARQLGVSTLSQSLGFTLAVMLDNYRGMTLAHEEDGSRHLLAMSHTYWDHYQFKDTLQQQTGSESALAWRNGSSLRISTARSKGNSRGRTLRFLHASEIAFWPDAAGTMLGLAPALPNAEGSLVILESTANGIGNFFHKTWEAAVDGEVEYEPLFFPWWKHPQHRGSFIGVDAKIRGLSPEERVLVKLGIDDDQLAWRRWALQNKTHGDERLFMQEYPATPEEAFLSTGTNVFPLPKLQAVYQPKKGLRGRLIRDGNKVEFCEDRDGPLTLFSYPSPAKDKEWGDYMVGCDATHTTFGDWAVWQVINRRSLEQVAVYKDRVDPGTFAEEMFKLGLYWNTAMLCPEKEGPWQQVIGRLLGMNYPRVYQHAKIDRTPGRVITDTWGWSTTMQTKHYAIAGLLKLVVDGINAGGIGLTIHDERTFAEMKNYVYLETGGFGNAVKEDHDDHVMALAIVCACHQLEPPLQPFGINDQLYWLPHERDDVVPYEPSWAGWESGRD